IAAYRAEDAETSEVLRSLIARRDAVEVREVALQPLPPEQAASLAAALLGAELADPEARAREIVREAGDNPFFVSELARYVGATGGSLERRPSAEPALGDMLAARLARFPAEAVR